jgi:hypothetical protein
VADQRTYSKGALPLSAHAKASFDAIYPPQFYNRIPKQGVFMDIGTGIGRDAIAVHNRSKGRLLVIGIEPEEGSYEQACAQYPDKDIVLCHNWDDVGKVKRNRQIAYLAANIQDLETPPPKLKADFINCSAVLMFVPEQEQDQFLQSLHRLSKPYRDIFLRWRTDMLKGQMIKVEERDLVRKLINHSFFPDVKPDFPDGAPLYRDFSWHDMIITPTQKGYSPA